MHKVLNYGAVGASVVLFIGLWFWAILPMHALAFNYDGWARVNAFDSSAIGEYEAMFQIDQTYKPYMWEYLSVLILQNPLVLQGGNQELFQKLTHTAFDEFEKLSSSYALGARDYYMAGRLGDFMTHPTEDDRNRIKKYLEIAGRLTPDNPNVGYEKAQFERNGKNVEGALDILIRLREKNPHVMFTYTNLGFAYLSKHDFTHAVESFDKAFSLGYVGWKTNSAYISAFIQLYTIDEFVKDHLPLIADFYAAAIELQPDNVENYVQLAAVDKELGKYAEAQRLAEEAVRHDPTIAKQAEQFIKMLPAH